MRSKLTNVGQLLVYAIFIYPMRIVFNLEIVNEESISVRKPLVAIANHQSTADAFIVLSAMGFGNFMRMFPWRSPIDIDWYKLPWVWLFSKTVGLYPIMPKGELSKSLASTFNFLDNGYSVFFFPEGKMVRKDEVCEPKKGIGYICQNRDVCLLPVRIIYRGYKKNGRGKIWGAKIIFGDQIDSKNLKQECPADKLHAALLDRIFALENSSGNVLAPERERV